MRLISQQITSWVRTFQGKGTSPVGCPKYGRRIYLEQLKNGKYVLIIQHTRYVMGKSHKADDSYVHEGIEMTIYDQPNGAKIPLEEQNVDELIDALIMAKSLIANKEKLND